MCFTERELITLAFVGMSSLPQAGVTVGIDIQSGWLNQNTAGVLRVACGDEYSYTPLFSLKRIRKKGLLRRDRPVPDFEDDDL
jgi:hypothetical protein